MKKWFQMILSVLVLTLMLSVPGMAIKAGTIATVTAKADKDQVTISGTVGDKVLAVSVLVYDEKGTTLVMMETVGVDSKKAFSDVLTLEDGTYVVKVADYDGGEYATTTITVDSATKPDDTKPDDTKPDDTKPDDTKPENTKPEDTKPENTKPEESKNKLEVTTGIKETDITADLKTAGMDSQEKITEKMQSAILEKNKDSKPSQNALFEVKLKVSTDGGTTWTEVTKENFPTEGVKVTIPYPTGTDMTGYDFIVAHMFAENMTLGGVSYTAGDVEFPAVTKSAEGLTFTVKSLSPIMVSWNAISNNSGNNNGGNSSDNSSNSNSSNSNTGNGSTGGTTSTSDTTTATDTSASAVQTNDSNAVVIWGSILMAAVLVMGGAVIMFRRKFLHR